MHDRTGVVAKMEARAKAEREAREQSTRRGLPPPAYNTPVFGAGIAEAPPADKVRPVNLLDAKAKVEEEEEETPPVPEVTVIVDATTVSDTPRILEVKKQVAKALEAQRPAPAVRKVEQIDSAAPLVIAIENDVPIPNKGGRKRIGIYKAVEDALMALKVGQSFVSPIPSKTTLAIIKTAQKKANATFWTRTIEEDKVRVWRVE